MIWVCVRFRLFKFECVESCLWFLLELERGCASSKYMNASWQNYVLFTFESIKSQLISEERKKHRRRSSSVADFDVFKYFRILNSKRLINYGWQSNRIDFFSFVSINLFVCDSVLTPNSRSAEHHRITFGRATGLEFDMWINAKRFVQRPKSNRMDWHRCCTGPNPFNRNAMASNTRNRNGNPFSIWHAIAIQCVCVCFFFLFVRLKIAK